MGIIICNKNSRKDNKNLIEVKLKTDGENNTTKESEKNNINNNINNKENLNTINKDTQKTQENLETNAVKEQSEDKDKQLVTLDSKVFVAKGNNDPNKL